MHNFRTLTHWFFKGSSSSSTSTHFGILYFHFCTERTSKLKLHNSLLSDIFDFNFTYITCIINYNSMCWSSPTFFLVVVCFVSWIIRLWLTKSAMSKIPHPQTLSLLSLFHRVYLSFSGAGNCHRVVRCS